jgi:RNA polymerase primary sigma factor
MRDLTISPTITIRDYQSLDRYFNDINKINLITANEEVVLAQKIRQGDQAALRQLISSNLRFVVSVAKQYQNQGLSIGDLINEGNIGLITAAKRFNENKGFKFISYAVWWIRQSIIFAIAEQTRVVHLPYSQITLMSKFNKAFARLEQQYGRKPSVAELATELETTVEKINDMIACSGKELSIDHPINADAETTLLDTLKTDESGTDRTVLNETTKAFIMQSLNTLCERESLIVRLYFGLNIMSPVPLEDIAKQIKLSTEQTRRIKDKALLRLKHSSFAPVLASCLNN